MSRHADAATAAIDAMLTGNETQHSTQWGEHVNLTCWRCETPDDVKEPLGLCHDCHCWLTEISDQDPKAQPALSIERSRYLLLNPFESIESSANQGLQLHTTEGMEALTVRLATTSARSFEESYAALQRLLDTTHGPLRQIRQNIAEMSTPQTPVQQARARNQRIQTNRSKGLNQRRYDPHRRP